MTADYIDPDDIERMIVRHETESRILGAYTDLDYSVSIRLHDATAVMLRSLAAENAGLRERINAMEAVVAAADAMHEAWYDGKDGEVARLMRDYDAPRAALKASD
jgi:hypothetical protein